MLEVNVLGDGNDDHRLSGCFWGGVNLVTCSFSADGDVTLDGKSSINVLLSFAGQINVRDRGTLAATILCHSLCSSSQRTVIVP